MLKINKLETKTGVYKLENKRSFKGLSLGKTASDLFQKIGKTIDTPQQRLIIGSTALVLHPIIDLTNKKVDKKTRETAASRSIARAIFGTISGIVVRTGCIKLGKSLVKKQNKFVNIKFPEGHSVKNIENYASSIGNVLALLTLLVTNFTFDLPYINKYQDIINEKIFGNKPEKTSKGGTLE